ncbi:MAG: helix-turn-helix domain-containing protein [Chloroflexi bacterium]|nr:helix-turn-helix domain-containing protein [Chloroflexota bacterium]
MPLPSMTPEQIRELRQALGMSLKEFGEAVGVWGESVWRWEHGRTRPHRLVLRRLWELKRRLDANTHGQ